MPITRESLEPELKTFLAQATVAYANGEMVEFTPADGSSKGVIYDSNDFTIVDKWDESEDGRVYSGSEVVTAEGELIWKAHYHGVVADDASPTEILAMYEQVLQEPDPDLPIRGPHVFERDNFLYALDSMCGPFEIGNFAAKDYIYLPETKSRAYQGYIIGGYINVAM